MNRLKELRNEASLTREQLAREAEVSYSSIMAHEQNRWSMRLTTAHKLAAALEKRLPYTLSYLLTEIATAEKENDRLAAVS